MSQENRQRHGRSDGELPAAAQKELEQAKWLLENPGLAARFSDLLGKPIESGLKYLPSDWSGRIGEITHAALAKALDVAVISLGRHGGDSQRPLKPARAMHNALVAFSGAAGGAFGLAAVAVELPISTSLIMRGVARIARENGEDLERIETRLACLGVLALGGKSEHDDSTDAGYWAVRGLLAKSVSDAAAHVARHGVASGGAPPLVRLLSTVAARFQVRVTQQVAAKAVPVIGAVAGGAINLAFADHFQNMARAHFTVRRLERQFGHDTVRKAYDQPPPASP